MRASISTIRTYLIWLLRKNVLLAAHFLKRSVSKGIFKCYINLKKCLRATFRCLAGRMWPAGRTLPRPALDIFLCSCLNFFSKFLFVKCQVYQWNMQTNYCIRIFGYEGHDPWHIVYKCHNPWHTRYKCWTLVFVILFEGVPRRKSLLTISAHFFQAVVTWVCLSVR